MSTAAQLEEVERCEQCHAPIDADQTLDYCFDPVECRSVVTCSAACARAYLAERPAPVRE